MRPLNPVVFVEISSSNALTIANSLRHTLRVSPAPHELVSAELESRVYANSSCSPAEAVLRQSSDEADDTRDDDDKNDDDDVGDDENDSNADSDTMTAYHNINRVLTLCLQIL